MKILEFVEFVQSFGICRREAEKSVKGRFQGWILINDVKAWIEL